MSKNPKNKKKYCMKNTFDISFKLKDLFGYLSEHLNVMAIKASKYLLTFLWRKMGIAIT